MKAELAHASPEQAAEEITHELIPSTESLPAAAPTTIAAPEENEEESEESETQPKFFGSDDMPDDMKQTCVAAARVALKLKTNRERAEHLKKFFDKTYNPPSGQGKWHCIVGTDFGSYITHESQNFLFFRLGAHYVLIFKA